MGVVDQPPCHLQDLCPEPSLTSCVPEQEHCQAFSVLTYWAPLCIYLSPAIHQCGLDSRAVINREAMEG